jgi:hypothetical protein
MFVCMPVQGFKVVSMVDVKQQAQMTHRCHGTYHCKKNRNGRQLALCNKMVDQELPSATQKACR